MKKKIIAIANDHSACEFRKPIIKYLLENNYEVLDLGTSACQSVNYPDYGLKMAQAIVAKKADFGILICGTGIGISIAANRVPGVRAALCYEQETVILAREHNDANVLALGARIIASEKAVDLVKTFLLTPASSDPRHKNRVCQLDEIK